MFCIYHSVISEISFVSKFFKVFYFKMDPGVHRQLEEAMDAVVQIVDAIVTIWTAVSIIVRFSRVANRELRRWWRGVRRDGVGPLPPPPPPQG